MTHVMNSAMMPAPGVYDCREITPAQFFLKVAEAHFAGRLQSHIAYPQNRDMIERMTGIRLELSRTDTRIENGDELLMMKVKYRPQGVKGAPIPDEDFEFFRATYRKHPD